MSLTLNAMGEQFAGLIDVTIVYRPTPVLEPCQRRTAWPRGALDLLPIPADLVHGDYQGDTGLRARFQDWIHSLWTRKETQLEHLRSKDLEPATDPAMT